METAKRQGLGQNTDDLLQMSELISLFLENIKFISYTLFTFVVFAVFMIMTRTPSYESTGLISVNSHSNTDMIARVIGDSIPTSPFARPMAGSEKSIIQSRSVLLPVVKKEHLDIVITPKTFSVVGTWLSNRHNATSHGTTPAPTRFGLPQYSWGGTLAEVSRFEVPSTLIGSTFKLIYVSDSVYKLYLGRNLLATGHIGKTLIAETQDGQVMLKVSKIQARPGNEFSIKKIRPDSAVSALTRQLSLSLPDRNSNLLELRLRGSSPEKTASVLDSIMQTAKMNSVNRRANEAVQTLNFLYQQLPVAKTSLEEAETALKNYRATSGTIEITAEAKRLMEQISIIEQQLSGHVIEKAQLQRRFTEDSFQIEQQDTAISQLHNQKSVLENSLKALPDADQIAIGLMRDVNIQNTVYTTLLSNIQQFEIIKAGTQGQLNIIDEANIPFNTKNKPSALIILLALFAGTFFSMSYLLIKQFVWQGIQDPELIENQFELDILGALHYSKTHLKQSHRFNRKQITHMKLLSEIDPHDLTVEGLRSLRTNLLFRLSEKGGNALAISGPIPGIGKSFTCANLAHTFAELGKRVILLDADIRKGDLHQFFDNNRSPGFCDVVLGQTELKDVIRKTRIDHFDFIPTGHMPEKHAELLMRPNVKTLIDTLKKDYDYVFIDTAPILAVTDSSLLLRYADIKMLTLAYRKHDRHEISLTLQKFNKAGVDIDGFVFNMIEQSHSYYGSKYRYEYRYGESTRTEKESA